MNNKHLLIIAGILICLGLFQSDLSKINIFNPVPVVVVDNTKIDVVKPEDPEVLALCEKVIESFKKGSSDRKVDAPRLASHASDMALLVEFNDDNKAVITNTGSIRSAVSLSGHMLRMKLDDKYPDLKTNMSAVVFKMLGTKNIPLDNELREKAVLSLRYLAWSCVEGSK